MNKGNKQQALIITIIIGLIILFIGGTVIFVNTFFQPRLIESVPKSLPVVPVISPIISIDISKQKKCHDEVNNIKCKDGMACMTNPASTFCICMGGLLETREKPEGQYGICKLNGKEYDEWELFRSGL